MTEAQVFAAGNYRYLPGVFQYSAGVAALPGYEIIRARFQRPLSLAEGFAGIERHMQAVNRPLTAFCACELRSPAPFTEAGFRQFNTDYVTTLRKWGLYEDQRNPVARSNVCPEIKPPAEPSFYAFSYTVPAMGGEFMPTCHIAGSGEVPEGRDNYRDHIVKRGDLSASGLRGKVRFVAAEMARRLAALQFAWPDTSAVQVYSVHNYHPIVADELVRIGAAENGLTWYFARPPIVDIEFEMDCRVIRREIVIASICS